MPAGTRDYITDDLVTKMGNDVIRMDSIYRAENPGTEGLIETITSQIGPGTHQGRLRVTLTDSDKRELINMQIREMMRKEIGEIEGAEKLQIGGGGRWGMPVSVSLQSDNLDQLQLAKDKLKNELRRYKELKDVIDNNPKGMKEVSLTLKEKAYSLGLTTSQVMNQVRSGFFGQEAQRILRGIDEVRIWVRYGEEERASISQLENMRIRLSDGRQFPLGELADLTIERGVMSIYHLDGQRVIKVEADIANSKISVPDMLSKIKTDVMPKISAEYPDVRFQFDGESRENDKTMASMMRVVPPMLLLMFLLVVFTFRSFTQAGVVYTLVPFALIGVAWGHFFQGYIISVLSLFGTIALVGIVINDSLVFVAAFNRFLQNGMSFKKALYQAGISRFRAVILTSVTTIAGLAPLIFETSIQAQFLSPMAISVAYGLLFGTVLTLIMLPALLVLNNKILRLFRSLLAGKKLTSEEAEPMIIEQKSLATMDIDN